MIKAQRKELIKLAKEPYVIDMTHLPFENVVEILQDNTFRLIAKNTGTNGNRGFLAQSVETGMLYLTTDTVGWSALIEWEN